MIKFLTLALWTTAKNPFSIPQRNCVIIKLRHHYFHHIITSPYYHLILVSRHLISPASTTSSYYHVTFYQPSSSSHFHVFTLHSNFLILHKRTYKNTQTHTHVSVI